MSSSLISTGGGEGHVSRDCSQEAKPKSCYKCGQEGHIVRFPLFSSRLPIFLTSVFFVTVPRLPLSLLKLLRRWRRRRQRTGMLPLWKDGPYCPRVP
ncbi:hypothetical protein BDQ17DRAFT_986769 [Cyathus striatus]|nr:hypothetical protein BDQ17DRAFT_986769 [Cyathus striatus]